MMKKLLFAALLFASLPALAIDATFYWSIDGNSTTLAAQDYSIADTTGTGVGGVSFNATNKKVGSHAINTTNASDYYIFTSTSICNVAEGTLAGWVQFKTAVPSSGPAVIAHCMNSGDLSLAELSMGSSQELALEIQSSGGTSAFLATSACNMQVDLWYFLIASWNVATDQRKVACYAADGTPINSNSSSADFSTAAPSSFTDFRVGNPGTSANAMWVDNVFASATYDAPFDQFKSITSYIPTLSAGPTDGTFASDSLQFDFTPTDQPGTLHVALCTNGQTIAAAADVISGTCSGGAALGTASAPALAAVADTITVGSLTAATTYDGYWVYVSDIGGKSTVGSLANKTTAASGVSAPEFTDGPTIEPAFNGHIVSGTLSADGEVCTVLCLPARSTPTADQIFLGVCGDGDAAGTGCNTWEEGVADSFTVVNVTDSLPRHDVYVAARGVETGDTLETYGAITAKTSNDWSCTADQGGTPENSPVQEIDNSAFSQNTDTNHWTQLSADGPVNMVCTATTLEVTEARILPTRDAVSDSVNTSADSVSFTLPGPGQYYVDVNGTDSGDTEDNPLFIFLSPLDTNVPVDNGTTIKTYTGPGMDLTGVTTLIVEPSTSMQTFDYGTNNGANPCDTAGECSVALSGGERTRFTRPFGTEIYIKGGAWVNGNIEVTGGGTGAFKLRGRGTLGGIIYENNADVAVHSNKVYMVETDTEGTTEIEGITIAESVGPVVRSNDTGLVYRDIKLFGEYNETGGSRLNNSAVFEDSFIKTNDDHVNMFGSNITVRNMVHWTTHNGCLYQLNWGNTATWQNNLVSEVDVIGNSREDGNHSQLINSGVVCTRNVGTNSSPGEILNQTYEDFRVDVEQFQLFSFTMEWEISGFTAGSGYISDITFRDWVVAADSVGGPNGWFNSGVVAGTDPDEDLTATNPGTITDFVFDNVTINGGALVEADLLCEGLADCDTFTITP